MIKFKNLGIVDENLMSINDLGFETPTEIQEKSLPHILEGKDVIAGSATGSGKTLAFGMGIIQNIEAGQGIQSL
ncbi:MAG: DEAD/DEAH box helicase, partial [Methanocellales archaeon]|nr:DEAD/DEAH box helicase [Methanocellales archaeon]